MPEGPSIVIAAEELAILAHKKILEVSGNSKTDIARLRGKKIVDLFSYGKYLNFQLPGFGFRIHFMMFGSYRINDERANRVPRLMLRTSKDFVNFYSCSIKFLEEASLRDIYDFRTDIMSPEWDKKYVLKKSREHPELSVDDLLMDQQIFTGVGNIIKNEVLFRRKLLPSTLVGDLKSRALSALVADAREYSLLFYELKKQYILKKNFKIYRKSACPLCGGKVTHRKTGDRDRMSHYCEACQK